MYQDMTNSAETSSYSRNSALEAGICNCSLKKFERKIHRKTSVVERLKGASALVFYVHFTFSIIHRRVAWGS